MTSVVVTHYVINLFFCKIPKFVSKMKTLRVKIEGMTCNSCVQTIEKQLSSSSGVLSVKVLCLLLIVLSGIYLACCPLFSSVS